MGEKKKLLISSLSPSSYFEVAASHDLMVLGKKSRVFLTTLILLSELSLWVILKVLGGLDEPPSAPMIFNIFLAQAKI